ncbi:CBS domain-containing protein [Streptomyces cavernicola]|uniref:CBS domain-containing protein n=1 Tax=Streptomyces cavernicola TaxID=3043613 RepID=A0ABT6SJF1_9ACTN|nr:CBS domain-containing protein [Streptomyces sp. B-S-A6]MDI3408295.1 CBS domain-containing protein [Streptomyces sp. B-S-A6]
MAGKLTARDIMTGEARCVGAHESLHDAARMMRDLDVGCLPICGDNNRITGMITDRDIVVTCCADGIDPATVQAGTLSGEVHWIDADAEATKALEVMETYHVKRLPVIDVKGGHRLIGIITEANVAKNLNDRQIAEFATGVYATA